MNREEKLKQAHEYTGSGELSTPIYNLTIGLFLIYGLFLTYILTGQIENFLDLIDYNTTLLLIGYFVSAIAGSIIISRAKSFITRFIAFHLIVVPLGLILGVVSYAYSDYTVIQTLIATASIVILMTALSVIIPNAFTKLGGILAVTLFATLIAQTLIVVMTGVIPGWIDWVMVVVFAGFIGYDWSIAQMYPKTLGNSILSASHIYLDVVNIFIRLLRIFGKRN